MRYFKTIENGYITSIGQGYGGVEITETEHNSIFDIIRNKPSAESGYDYRLKTDLTWELYELPPMPEDDDITDAEALEIIRGGAV